MVKFINTAIEIFQIIFKGKEIEHPYLDGKNVKIIKYKSKNSMASNTNFGIAVTDTFFDIFNEEERKSILSHELYHKKMWLKYYFQSLLNVYFPFVFCKTMREQEFLADEYALEKHSKTFINVLKKIKKLGFCLEQSNDHPSIDERILKAEQYVKEKSVK